MRPPAPPRQMHAQKPPRRTRKPKPPCQMCAPKLPRQTWPTVPPRQTRTMRHLEFLLKYPCNQYSRRVLVHVARDFFQFFTEVSREALFFGQRRVLERQALASHTTLYAFDLGICARPDYGLPRVTPQRDGALHTSVIFAKKNKTTRPQTFLPYVSRPHMPLPHTRLPRAPAPHHVPPRAASRTAPHNAPPRGAHPASTAPSKTKAPAWRTRRALSVSE